MTHAQAAVLRDAHGEFTLEEILLSEPLSDEIVVRISATGMCQSDQGGRRSGQFLPAILGHEGAGTIERVGDAVQDLEVGDHVILTFDTCRRCASCLAGRPHLCGRFFELNGVSSLDGGRVKARDGRGNPLAASWFGQSSFASHVLVRASNAVRVPKDVPLESLCPLGCGFQTGLGAVLNGLDIGQGSSVAIFGAGSVGLSAVIGAVLAGADEIVAIDVSAERLRLAVDLGATRTVLADPQADDVGWQHDMGPWQFTVETTGLPHLMDVAIRSLGDSGHCGFLGANKSYTLDTRALAGRNLTFLTVGNSDPQVFIPRLVELWRAGRLPLERLVTTYPLAEINEAQNDAASGAVVKPILVPTPI